LCERDKMKCLKVDCIVLDCYQIYGIFIQWRAIVTRLLSTSGHLAAILCFWGFFIWLFDYVWLR
jgi:hypothetical protein